MNQLEYRIAGDTGVLIAFGHEINEETLQRILSFEEALKKNDIPGIVETNWGFLKLFIFYDPEKTDYDTLHSQLIKVEQKLSSREIVNHAARIIEIPVVYGGEYGPDLQWVAERLNLSEEEVIQRHLSSDYLIYITGHIGGSAFFKGEGSLFNLPRKKTPVISYPEGSVLFASGMGCSLKAADGPTAWYGLGRSPLRQWNPHKDPPTLINSGDRIRYRQIEEDEFYKIRQDVEQDTYQLKYV